MKKKFTFLIAALALLTMINLPGKAVGQTRENYQGTFTRITSASDFVTGYYVVTPSQSASTTNKALGNAVDDNKRIAGVSVTIENNQIVNPVNTVVYYITVSTSGNTTTCTFQNVNTGKYMYQASTTSGKGMGFSDNAADITLAGYNTSSPKGFRFTLNGTSNNFLKWNNSSSWYANYANDYTTTMTPVELFKLESTPSVDPSLSVDPSSISFGSVAINPSSAYTQTFDVTFANLTQALTVTGFTGVTVSPSTIATNASSPATVTVSYNPTTAGNLSGSITVSNTDDNLSETVAVTGSAYDPANVTYYEKVTGALSNWSGEYIFTGINSSNYYAFTGISYSVGTAELVTVKENGIQSTSSTDGYKVTVAQTTNGYSLYLEGAGYLYYTGSSNLIYAASTFTESTCEWTFSFANGVATITNVGNSSRILQFNYNSGNPRFVCYGNSGQTKITLFKYNDPNKVKTPTFLPEGGEYVAAQSVAISSETSGASIYYTIDGSTPTTASTLYTSAFTVSSTTTVKAIAVKSGMTNSDVASATYTFVTPFTTMQQVYEDAVANTSEHEVYITFNNWVITGTNGSSPSQFYLTDPDNTYGCVIYGSGSGFTRGNTLTGTVKCKLLYFSSGSAYSFAEIKELTTETAGLTVGTEGSVTPITTTINDLTFAKTGTVVKLENLTYNGTVLTDNNNNIINNCNYIYSATLTANKTYDVTGVFAYAYEQNNTPKRICPRSADDIEESFVPTITLTSVSVAADADNCTMAITNNMSATSFTIKFFNETGTTQIEKPSWIEEALIAEENGDYMVSCTFDPNTGAERKAYLRVASGEVTSNLATLTQAKYIPTPTNDPYVRIGSLDYLTDGSIVVIAARYNGTANAYYAMQNSTSGKPTGVVFTSDAEKLPATFVNNVNDYYWVVNVTNGEYTFTNANGSMIGWSDGTNFTSSTNTAWTIERQTSGENAMVGEYKGFVIKNANTNTRAFALNSSHNFGPYGTTNATSSSYNFYLDFFVQTADETYTHAVNGYTTNTNGWNLIASPVATTPSEVTNMTSNDYDLYRFNQSAGNGLVWENYENSAHQSGFTITPGQGYLYANSGTVTLSFTGTPYVGDGVITMLNAGWNLVGNPYYNTTTNIGRDYYRMNSTNDGLIPASGSENVNAWEGIFVVAAQANETVTFTKVNPEGNAGSGNNNSTVVMSLTQNRSGVVDRAIVRFDVRENLPKFQLFENSTKLSLVQDNEEYAIVSTEAHGVMPVSFKANQNGQYTITVNTEDVEMGYLHLVDNMTGADIDLLNTPSYTFNARTDDYTSRFKLVFSANGMNNENGNDDFAFLSDGQLIIANDGEATLQVIDITGRILSSEVINGSCSKNIDAATGVYVLRLVNGSNVKTQKVIIK